MGKNKLIVILSYIVLAASIILIGISLGETINPYILVATSYAGGMAIAVLINMSYNANLRKRISWLEDRVKLTNSIAYRVKIAGEKCFSEIPVGIILYNNNYVIEWVNAWAKKIFLSPLVDRRFSSISKELETKVRSTNEFTIEIYGKVYSVSVLREDNILFLTDKTEIRKLEKKYFERTQVTGIINLDNFEEAMSSIDAQQRAMKISEIIGILSEWCSRFEIYIRGYSEKQYLILMDREQLEKVIQEKFKVIDDVNDYCNKEGLRITISLGVACFDGGINDLMDKSNDLLELALNRGGNQAAVQIDDTIKYYGGKDKGIDTRLPVYVRVKTEDLRELILSSSNVLIMMHSNTDADAFGGAIALLEIVKALKVDCKIILNQDQCDITVSEVFDEIKSEHMGMMEHFINSRQAYSLVKDNTLLILVDCQYAKLLVDEKIYHKAKRVAIIDHHRSNNTAIANCCYSYNKTTSSSSVELIVEMFDYIDEEITITGIEATLMLLGIIVDTNNLIHRTSSQTFTVLSKLQGYGAEMTKVQRFLREDFDLYLKRLNILNNIEIIDGKYGIAMCDVDEIYTRQFIAKVADNCIAIDLIEAGFCIGRIDESTVAVSARSLDECNVQIIMEALGGGGHFNNAATQIKNVTISETKEKLIKALRGQESVGEETMKIILTKDVKGKGKAGDIIDIPSGHANYLIKTKNAILGTVDNLNELKRRSEQDKIKAQEDLEAMRELKEFIEKNPISIEVRVGKEGKLFGSVSTKHIADELKSKYNVVIDKRKIIFDKDIDSLGTYLIPVQLHKEVLANITLYVVEKKG